MPDPCCAREAFIEELACLDGLRVLELNFFNKEVFNEYMKAIQSGVGKTAVAQAVCNKALFDVQETFGYVIWVEAEYEIQLKSFQEKMMKKLNIELIDTDDDKDRAIKIRDEFVPRKKCLVIIDFLWEDFTLRDIGIPLEEAKSGVVCKVILTSRSKFTCSRIPKDEYCEIKPLCGGWEFFKRSLDSSLLNLEGEAGELMKKAVEGCGGLPSEIIMLASHMRGKHCQSSSEIASSLKKMLSSRTKSAPSNDAHLTRLKYSYERLENATYRHCFLYCAFYPKGFPIEEEQLIDNWLWEGLLDEYIMSPEEKREQGKDVLMALKSARLIEKADSGGTREAVKMLSFLHDMAVNIMIEQRLGVLISAGNDLREFPPIDDQKGEIQLASFMHNKLGVLKTQPNCPKLSKLLLQNNPLHLFSDSFFTGIPNLKILDLSHTNIFNLSSSVCNLKLLQVLRLRYCLNLRSLPPLSNLEELIVLDLFGTPLAELPLGMERLTKLKRLDLSHTKITKFQAGLLSTLESLQELILMMNDAEAYSWRSEQTISCSGEAFVEELACLDGLRVLELNFFNKEVFNEYMKAIQCTTSRSHAPRFKFCVGGFNTDGNLGENSIAFIDGYPVDQQLPEGTLELYLSGCSGSGSGSSSSSIGPNNTLEKTGIDFQNLKVLNLFDCSSLTYLFSFEMLHCLQSLEKIHVRNCWSLSMIIKPSVSSDPRTDISCRLLKIQELILIDLPMLESICPEQYTLEGPEFRRFSVWNCDKLERLPVVVSSEKIKLRANSSRLAGSCYIHEEANIPTDTVSFVRTKIPESLQPTPNYAQTSYYWRKVVAESRKKAQISIGVLFF
ncbi:hypothetical protein SOVF_193370 [Spinacia oleracea]|nr:hypothetical protein SOVF_193370 [Spinacia oleracea]